MSRTALCAVSLVLGVACNSSGPPLPATARLDFGDVAVGVPVQKSVTLANSGGTAIQIVSVDAPTDAEFSAALSAGTPIPTHGQLDISVTFKPFGGGAKSGRIVLHTDSAAVPLVTMQLSGSGVVVDLAVAPLKIDFGNVAAHTSETQAVTLTNNASTDIVVTVGAFTGESQPFFTASPQGPITVKAGGTEQVLVTYAPTTPEPGSDSATLPLAVDVGGSILVQLSGASVEQNLFTHTLPCPFVQLGSNLTLDIQLQNIGQKAVDVTQVSLLPDGDTTFTLSGSAFSGSVVPGQTVHLPVLFTPPPQGSGYYSATVSIQSDDVIKLTQVPVCGYGGGAVASCSPLAVDFSQTATNVGSTRTVVCSNLGTNIAGHPEAALQLTDVSTNNPLFSVSFDSPFPAAGLLAGQSAVLDLSYQPTADEADTATLTVTHNVPNQSPLAMALSGTGVVEQACRLATSDSALDFGLVAPGTSETLGLTLTNAGDSECLINGLALVQSDPSFALPAGPIASQRLSPASGGPFPSWLTVPVTFTPTMQGAVTGQLDFTLSNPGTPNRTVQLSGTGGDSCLKTSPSSLGFFAASTGGALCHSNPRSFELVNQCGRQIAVNTLTLNGPFALVGAPTLPLQIPAATSSTPLAIQYQPSQVGGDTGDLQIASDVSDTALVLPLSGTASSGDQETETFTVQPKADVLFVVDTSANSTAGSQISGAISHFLDAASGGDYQIGVTSTDVCAGPSSENGRMLPCPGCKLQGSARTFITPADSTASADLATLLDLPGGDSCTGSLTPQYFQAAYDALFTEATYNQGFLRPDTALAIISVGGTFGDDQSFQYTTQQFAADFASVNGAGFPSLLSFSFVAPLYSKVAANGSVPITDLPTHIRTMISLVGGVGVDTTQAYWWQALDGLWQTLLLPSVFYLVGAPVADSIQVSIDAARPFVPGEWSFDQASDSISFNLSQVGVTAGDTVTVTYAQACF